MHIISHFYGILIKLEYKANSEPVFYAWYMNNEALFNLEGEILSGTMPRKQELIIAAWAELRRAEIVSECIITIIRGGTLMGAHFCPDLINIKPLEDYKVYCEFADGKKLICDLSNHLDRGVFKL